ncbi:hypothetical protein C8R46DRAFT_1035095 [Mycena filopes]|nr:hypothetical protein C8R46DRAFT_1035095 [Mycena filopes]
MSFYNIENSAARPTIFKNGEASVAASPGRVRVAFQSLARGKGPSAAEDAQDWLAARQAAIVAEAAAVEAKNVRRAARQALAAAEVAAHRHSARKALVLETAAASAIPITPARVSKPINAHPIATTRAEAIPEWQDLPIIGKVGHEGELSNVAFMWNMCVPPGPPPIPMLTNDRDLLICGSTFVRSADRIGSLYKACVGSAAERTSPFHVALLADCVYRYYGTAVEHVIFNGRLPPAIRELLGEGPCVEQQIVGAGYERRSGRRFASAYERSLGAVDKAEPVEGAQGRMKTTRKRKAGEEEGAGAEPACGGKKQRRATELKQGAPNTPRCRAKTTRMKEADPEKARTAAAGQIRARGQRAGMVRTSRREREGAVVVRLVVGGGTATMIAAREPPVCAVCEEDTGQRAGSPQTRLASIPQTRVTQASTSTRLVRAFLDEARIHQRSSRLLKPRGGLQRPYPSSKQHETEVPRIEHPRALLGPTTTTSDPRILTLQSFEMPMAPMTSTVSIRTVCPPRTQCSVALNPRIHVEYAPRSTTPSEYAVVIVQNWRGVEWYQDEDYYLESALGFLGSDAERCGLHTSGLFQGTVVDAWVLEKYGAL